MTARFKPYKFLATVGFLFASTPAIFGQTSSAPAALTVSAAERAFLESLRTQLDDLRSAIKKVDAGQLEKTENEITRFSELSRPYSRPRFSIDRDKFEFTGPRQDALTLLLDLRQKLLDRGHEVYTITDHIKTLCEYEFDRPGPVEDGWTKELSFPLDWPVPSTLSQFDCLSLAVNQELIARRLPEDQRLTRYRRAGDYYRQYLKLQKALVAVVPAWEKYRSGNRDFNLDSPADLRNLTELGPGNYLAAFSGDRGHSRNSFILSDRGDVSPGNFENCARVHMLHDPCLYDATTFPFFVNRVYATLGSYGGVENNPRIIRKAADIPAKRKPVPDDVAAKLAPLKIVNEPGVIIADYYTYSPLGGVVTHWTLRTKVQPGVAGREAFCTFDSLTSEVTARGVGDARYIV